MLLTKSPAAAGPHYLLLNEHSQWFFQQPFECLQEGGATGTIHYAVITAQRYFHHVAGYHAAILYNRHLRDPANGEDTGIGWIDDRGELVYAEHAQVGNGERAAFPISWLEF